MAHKGKKITVHDMTLRDGMHPKQHKMTLEQMTSIAQGLDAAGVPLIEVTHGDGLGGSSINYGFPAHTDEEYLSSVIPLMKQAKVSALLLPGIGTVDNLKMAYELGVHTIRVATHCSEADVSQQHIQYARNIGMDTVGFLMMAHMASPEQLLEQALLMESYGANCIYCTDSAGYMLPEDVKARIGLLRENSIRKPSSAFTAITTWRWAWLTRWWRWNMEPTGSMPRLQVSVLVPAIHRWKFSSQFAPGPGSRLVSMCSKSRM